MMEIAQSFDNNGNGSYYNYSYNINTKNEWISHVPELSGKMSLVQCWLTYLLINCTDYIFNLHDNHGKINVVLCVIK